MKVMEKKEKRYVKKTNNEYILNIKIIDASIPFIYL
jgi:hypothetical protein